MVLEVCGAIVGLKSHRHCYDWSTSFSVISTTVCLCACRYSCEIDVGGRVLQVPGYQNTAPRVEPVVTTISRVPTKHVCTPVQHDATLGTYHWPLLSAPYTNSNVVCVDVHNLVLIMHYHAYVHMHV